MTAQAARTGIRYPQTGEHRSTIDTALEVDAILDRLRRQFGLEKPDYVELTPSGPRLPYRFRYIEG